VALPPLYHFTSAASACTAVEDGLKPGTSPGDPLELDGVWLSPNIYGFGSAGSAFGAVGLRVSPEYLKSFDCVYVGLKDGTERHRFVLRWPGDGSDLVAKPTPEGLPNGETACELLALAAIPSSEITEVYFCERMGFSRAKTDLEHQRFFAHLLATRHRLLAAVRDPHSTTCSVFGLFQRQIPQLGPRE
jgi:hypothetical protein